MLRRLIGGVIVAGVVGGSQVGVPAFAAPAGAATRTAVVQQASVRLDGLTTGLLTELVRVDHLRHTGIACDISLLVATTTGAIEHHLDRLHRQALAVGSRTVCKP